VILVLLACLQEVEPVPAAPLEPCEEIFATARVGAWRHGAFDAQTTLGRREIESGFLALGGLDLGARYHQLTGWLSLDYGDGDDLSVAALGAHIGWRERLSESLWGMLSTGLLAARLDVDASGFGDFDPALGLQLRGELSTLLGSATRVSLWADYRQLGFDYDEPTLSGDDEAFGPTFAFGGSLSIRF